MKSQAGQKKSVGLDRPTGLQPGYAPGCVIEADNHGNHNHNIVYRVR